MKNLLAHTLCLVLLCSACSSPTSEPTGPTVKPELVRCGIQPLAKDGIDLPLRAAFDDERFRYLPKIRQLLVSGAELQAVVLGDSIMNDTFGPQYGGANFHTSTAWGMDNIASVYDARVWTIVSVLGSTGVWWYREGDRVQTYVLQYRPDVVLIGGISNRDDFDGMREVIRKIREHDATTEIVLLSDAVNLSAVPTGPSLSIAADEDSYRAKLQQLANELQVAFIDMRGPYNDFVRRVNQMYPAFGHDYFQRDPVHANDRGRDVLRGIVTMFMTTDDRSCSL